MDIRSRSPRVGPCSRVRESAIMTRRHRFIGAFIFGVAVSVAAPAGAQDVSGAQPDPPAQAPAAAAAPEAKKPDPFAFGDFTWLSGNPRTKESPLDTKVFTGEFRADTNLRTASTSR